MNAAMSVALVDKPAESVVAFVRLAILEFRNASTSGPDSIASAVFRCRAPHPIWRDQEP